MGRISTETLNKKAAELNVEILERFTGNDKHTKLKIVSLLHPEKGERIVDQYNFLYRTTKCWYFNENSCKEDLLKNEDISSKIEILGDYINNNTKILCKCKICNNEWFVSPNKLLCGRGCPKCAIKRAHMRYKKTNKDFVNEMLQKNPTLIILSEYYNSKTKISYKCNLCGRISVSTPQKLLNGESGCHFCKSSMGERFIYYFLEKYNVCFQKEKYFFDCRYKNPLPFDFSYTPTIESKIKAKNNFEKIQIRDKIKLDYCRTHNIRLLIISYTQIKQIEDILIKELKLSTVTTAGSL